MSTAVVVGNPKPQSRTYQAGVNVAYELTGLQPDLVVDLADFGPKLLEWGDPEVANALKAVASHDLLIVASPTYKATYTGLLKVFLDQLPSGGLAGVSAVAVMLGGHWGHALAPELQLKPLLVELGATVPTKGLFLLDSEFTGTKALAEWVGTARGQLSRTAPGAFASTTGDVISTHVLDNPVWTSLTGPHAHLAVRVGQAARYPSDAAVFVGVAPDADEAVWADLRTLVAPGTVVGLTGSALEPPADWEVVMSGEGVQLVSTDALESRPFAEAVVLGADDAQDMLDLVALTQPGPFLPRTYLLGTYLGVRHEGRLVALAGERLHPPGFTEISAVCTHPDFRGRGYGTRLVQAVAHVVRERGDVPILHAAASNTNAIRLYESIGFTLRARPGFMGVRVPEQ